MWSLYRTQKLQILFLSVLRCSFLSAISYQPLFSKRSHLFILSFLSFCSPIRVLKFTLIGNTSHRPLVLHFPPICWVISHISPPQLIFLFINANWTFCQNKLTRLTNCYAMIAIATQSTISIFLLLSSLSQIFPTTYSRIFFYLIHIKTTTYVYLTLTNTHTSIYYKDTTN